MQIIVASLLLFEFVTSYRTIPKISYTLRSFSLPCIESNETWPGNRFPTNNPELLDQRMEATWGRGKFRTEVWNDDANPINDWWTAYTPSQEEREAAAKGFRFSDPKGWCEENNIDYEAALKDLQERNAANLKKYREKKEKDLKEYANEKFMKVEAEYLYWKKIQKEYNFRKLDNELQAKKGQPSLDDEETGVKFKNDPI